MIIIEFYGLPGTGKTTIAKNIAMRGGENVDINKNKLGRVYYSLFFLLKQPKKFFFLFNLTTSEFKFCTSHKFLNLYIYRLKLLIDKMAKYGYAYKHSSNDEVLFIDEGFFQHVISMCERKKTLEEMTKIVNILPKPDILIMLSSQELLLERINRIREKKERYKTRIEKFGSEYVERKFDVITHNDRVINDTLNEQNGIKTIKLSTSDKTVGQVVSDLDERLNSLDN